MRIHPETRIGHVHLTVADLDRSLRFYRDVLGFQVTTRYGSDAVFLSAGGYSRFSIRTARRSRPPCDACSRRASRSRGRPITA